MRSAHAITKARGGTWHGTWGAIPGPGHSPRDRSTSLHDGDDGGVLVHSFAGHDWRVLRDDLARDGLIATKDALTLTRAERIGRNRQRRAAEAARNADKAGRSDDATERARLLWSSSPKACPDHPYLVAKHLPPSGLRVSNGDLIVSIGDMAGQLRTVQRIRADGSKRYFTNGPIKGNCWRAGPLPEDSGCVLIGEGWATCAALHETTGLPVAAAMDAGNMDSVARLIRARCPSATIILCADIDPNRVGETKATAAAAAVRGMVARPPRPAEWDDTRALDFADVWALPGGADAIRRVFGDVVPS